MKKPIGYPDFCQALLDAGVSSKQIIKHRMLLQAIAAQARSKPARVSSSLRAWGFDLCEGNRTVDFALDTLSTTGTMRLVEMTGKATLQIRNMKALAANSETAMLWLYPFEYAWHERLRIWLEKQWMAIKYRYAKMRNYVD